MKIAFLEIEDDIEYKLKDHKILNFKKNINKIDLNLIKDCEIISIRSKSQVTDKILEKLSKLKYIITRTVGIDHLNLKIIKKKDITVSNIPNYGSDAIAEYVFGLLLTGMRKIIKANEDTRKGNFSSCEFKGDILRNKTLGVIGTGNVGERVAKIGKGFGMKIICYDIIKKKDLNYVSLNNLLKESDIITLHIPSTAETKYIINKVSINKMKEGVILINTSRGDLINTKDLIDLNKKFSFICLDVLEDEASFSKNNNILSLKNLILTPHIAFNTLDSIDNVRKMTVDCVNSYIKGSPKNLV